MKVHIDKERFIIVTAETVEEALALENVTPTQSNCGACGVLEHKLLIDLSVMKQLTKGGENE